MTLTNVFDHYRQHCFTWSGTRKVNEVQGDVAVHWGIPFLDMGNNIMINNITKDTLTSDGCHPNSAGQSVIADFVKDWLISHTNHRTK